MEELDADIEGVYINSRINVALSLCVPFMIDTSVIFYKISAKSRCDTLPQFKMHELPEMWK